MRFIEGAIDIVNSVRIRTKAVIIFVYLGIFLAALVVLSRYGDQLGDRLYLLIGAVGFLCFLGAIIIFLFLLLDLLVWASRPRPPP